MSIENSDVELGRAIFRGSFGGSGRSGSGSSDPGNATVMTGLALSDSADGRVLVDTGGQTVAASQGVDLPCTCNVRAGDKVIITLVGNDPTVTGVVGRGDQQQGEIDGAQSSADEAKRQAEAAKRFAEEVDGKLDGAKADMDAAKRQAEQAKAAADAASRKADQTAADVDGKVKVVADAAARASEKASTAATKADQLSGKVTDVTTTVSGLSTKVEGAARDATSALKASSETRQTVSALTSTVEQHYTEQRATAGKADKAASDAASSLDRVSKVEQTAAGIQTQVTATSKTASDALSKASTAQQTADAITTKVTKEYTSTKDADAKYASQSQLTQTAEGLTSKVTTAQRTADAAKTAASTAKQTADGLTATVEAHYTEQLATDRKATDAATAAGSAQRAADAAGTRAQVAVDKATTAQATADGVKVQVTKAQSDASAALKSASTAKQTADAITATVARDYLSKADASKSYASQSSVKQTADQIRSEVRSSYVDKATGSMLATKAELSAKADEIASSVAKTYAKTSAIPGLIVNPGFEAGDMTGWSAGDCSDHGVDGKSPHQGSFKLWVRGAGKLAWINSREFPVTAGHTYRVSCWVDSDVPGLEFGLEDSSAKWRPPSVRVDTGRWVRVSVDMRAPGDYTHARLHLGATLGASQYLRADDFELEDVTDVLAVSSRLTQTADGLTAAVSKKLDSATAASTYAKASELRQTADGLSVKVTTAQRTADAAKGSAGAAQTTADGAANAANGAKAAADKAQTTANTANSTANSAKTAAATAQSTANAAKTTAAGAVQKGSSGISSLETAMVFDSGGLSIFKKVNGAISGFIAKVTGSAFQICSKTGTVLSQFAENRIDLGRNSQDTTISMCQDNVRIYSSSKGGAGSKGEVNASYILCDAPIGSENRSSFSIGFGVFSDDPGSDMPRETPYVTLGVDDAHDGDSVTIGAQSVRANGVDWTARHGQATGTGQYPNLAWWACSGGLCTVSITHCLDGDLPSWGSRTLATGLPRTAGRAWNLACTQQLPDGTLRDLQVLVEPDGDSPGKAAKVTLTQKGGPGIPHGSWLFVSGTYPLAQDGGWYEPFG